MGNANSLIGGLVRALALGVLPALALVQPAGASLLTTGDVATYNFDFTGQSPPPPYTGLMEVDFTWQNEVPGSSVATFQYFDGLNAIGTAFTAFSHQTLGTGGLSFFTLNFPQQLDGIFSIEVTVNNGPLEITGVTADAFNVPDFTFVPPVATVAGTLAVDEPPALALMLAGLAGIAVWRRRDRAPARVMAS